MRRGGIVKVQEIAADLGVDGVEQRIRGQRAGRDDDSALRESPSPRRRPPSIFGWFLIFSVTAAAKAVAVDRQCAARLHAVCIRAGKDQAVQTAQLLLEQTGGVCQLVRAQRVGAHQLGEIVRSGAPASCCTGFISHRRTEMPRCASCHAASQPASPAPTTVTISLIRRSPLPWSFSLRQASFAAAFFAAAFFAFSAAFSASYFARALAYCSCCLAVSSCTVLVLQLFEFIGGLGHPRQGFLCGGFLSRCLFRCLLDRFPRSRRSSRRLPWQQRAPQPWRHALRGVWRRFSVSSGGRPSLTSSV